MLETISALLGPHVSFIHSWLNDLNTFHSLSILCLRSLQTFAQVSGFMFGGAFEALSKKSIPLRTSKHSGGKYEGFFPATAHLPTSFDRVAETRAFSCILGRFLKQEFFKNNFILMHLDPFF